MNGLHFIPFREIYKQALTANRTQEVPPQMLQIDTQAYENFYFIARADKMLVQVGGVCVVFNAREGRIGTAKTNVPTNLTLESSSKDIFEAVLEYRKYLYRELSKRVYSQMIGKSKSYGANSDSLD